MLLPVGFSSMTSKMKYPLSIKYRTRNNMLAYNLTLFNHFKCIPTLTPLRRLIKIYLWTIADGKNWHMLWLWVVSMYCFFIILNILGDSLNCHGIVAINITLPHSLSLSFADAGSARVHTCSISFTGQFMLHWLWVVCVYSLRKFSYPPSQGGLFFKLVSSTRGLGTWGSCAVLSNVLFWRDLRSFSWNLQEPILYLPDVVVVGYFVYRGVDLWWNKFWCFLFHWLELLPLLLQLLLFCWWYSAIVRPCCVTTCKVIKTWSHPRSVHFDLFTMPSIHFSYICGHHPSVIGELLLSPQHRTGPHHQAERDPPCWDQHLHEGSESHTHPYPSAGSPVHPASLETGRMQQLHHLWLCLSHF